MKRDGQGWLAQPEYKGLVVMDPDGWNRTDFDNSWREEITKEEFDRRVLHSTCVWWSSGAAHD